MKELCHLERNRVTGAASRRRASLPTSISPLRFAAPSEVKEACALDRSEHGFDYDVEACSARQRTFLAGLAARVQRGRQRGLRQLCGGRRRALPPVPGPDEEARDEEHFFVPSSLSLSLSRVLTHLSSFDFRQCCNCIEIYLAVRILQQNSLARHWARDWRCKKQFS